MRNEDDDDSITTRWGEAVGSLSEESVKVIASTKTVVKVTHFGSVRLSFTWTRKSGGQLPWTTRNVETVKVMVQMVVRLLEICS